MLASSTGGGEIGGGKKSKKGSSAVSMERSKHGTLLKDFRVEYSKSGGAMCKGIQLPTFYQRLNCLTVCNHLSKKEQIAAL